jgi:iron complex outermembrane receptor protein
MNTLNTRYRLIHFGLVALLPLAGAVSSFGQVAASAGTSEEKIVQLPQFTVTSTRADPYLPTDAVSVSRVAESLMNSPFTVNVVTKELMDDLGINVAFDVTRYTSGVSPGRGTGAAGFMERQDYRGFEALSRTVDNFSGFLLPTGSGNIAPFDPAFVERTELVMGPDSILSPTGTPGGSINMITKSPKFEQGTDVTAEVGTYNAQKFVIDTTGPVPIGDGKHWAYRAIASVQDTETFTPGRLKQSSGSLQLEYKISSSAKITFKYFGQEWELDGPVTNANDNGEIVYTPDMVGGASLPNSPQPGETYNGANGDASWSTRMDRVNIGELELTSALGEHVNARFAAQILFDNINQNLCYPSSSPSETFDPNTGQVIGVSAFNPAAVPTIALRYFQISRDLQFQNDYAGSFHPGPVSIQPVVGWASQVGRQTSIVINDASRSDLPLANLLADSYDPPIPPISQYTGFSVNSPAEASLFQVYGVARLGFFRDRLFLTAGASRTWATVNDYSFKGVYLPQVGQVGAAPNTANYLQVFTFKNTGNAIAPTQKDYRDSHSLGALAKLTPNVSLYASDSSDAGIAAGHPLWQCGQQYEFGLKSEFFNQRLQFTAAHFQIAQSNVTTINPLFNIGQSSILNLLENQTNHGFEFNLAGGLTRNLSVIASVTEMKLRDPLGRRVRNIPDNMANLLLNYHFTAGALKSLSVFVGVSHVGDVAGETESGVTSLGVPDQPGFYLKPWTVVNAGAGYVWGRYHFNLNVDNVLDSKFWWQPAGRISVSLYPGITFRLTTSVHF